MVKQLVAMGGGGFSMEPENPLLDAFVLSLAAQASGKPKPSVCFLPTASNDSVHYIRRFYTRFKRFTRNLSHLALLPEPSKADIRAHLLAQDLIYVGGGNTKSMLELWRAHGVDQVLREAYEQGVVLAGISAGAICWFEWGMSDFLPGQLTPLPCLGLLPGSCNPHYDGEPGRRPALQKAVGAHAIPPGWGLDDGVAVHYVDSEVQRIVTSRPDARAWRVELTASGTVKETEYKPDYLGGQGQVIRRVARGDAPGLLETHHRSVRGIAARDYTPEQVEAWTHRLPDGETLATLEGQILTDAIWVLEVDGQIEGYAHMRTPMEIAPAAYLHALYLTPAVAGQGLGKRLMRLAEAEATRLGLPAMQLHASKTALGFYATLGYRRVGAPILHVVQGVGLECFPMVKELLTKPALAD